MMADDFYTVEKTGSTLRHAIARWLAEDETNLAWEDLEDIEQRGYLATAKVLVEDVITDPDHLDATLDALSGPGWGWFRVSSEMRDRLTTNGGITVSAATRLELVGHDLHVTEDRAS